MKKIKLYIISFLLQGVLYVLFKTNKWKIIGEENLKRAITSDKPIFLCTWHSRFLYAVYFLKIRNTSNLWAISSTHQDSQIMAYFLKRSYKSVCGGVIHPKPLFNVYHLFLLRCQIHQYF